MRSSASLDIPGLWSSPDSFQSLLRLPFRRFTSTTNGIGSDGQVGYRLFGTCIPVSLRTIRNNNSACNSMTTVTQTKPTPSHVQRVLRADARRNREAVMAAAKKLFADQGLDAQMPDVAKAAKVGVGTVYRHFPTKDDLIAALAAERFELLAERAQEALEEEDPWGSLCDFIRFAAQIQADDRGLCEVMSSRPEVMNASALAVGLDELCDQVVKRAQRS